MTNLVSRIENLKKEINEITLLKVELKTNERREREECQIILDKMKEMGLNHKTLKDDILNMERDIELKMNETEKEVKEARFSLEDIALKVREVNVL